MLSYNGLNIFNKATGVCQLLLSKIKYLFCQNPIIIAEFLPDVDSNVFDPKKNTNFTRHENNHACLLLYKANVGGPV